MLVDSALNKYTYTQTPKHTNTLYIYIYVCIHGRKHIQITRPVFSEQESPLTKPHAFYLSGAACEQKQESQLWSFLIIRHMQPEAKV